MLPHRFRLWLFDRLSKKTMRYVSAVPKKKATGLTKRVYDMIDDDFFMNGSLTSRSLVPELLAAIWTSGRETMLVDDHLDRTTKEAISGVLSDLNDCPYCGDMLISLVDAGKEHDAASAIYKGGVQKIANPRLRDQLAWVEAVGKSGAADIPPCPFTAEELPEVLGSLMAMADINRFSHVVMDGSPVQLPFGLQRPALRLFGNELKATKRRSAEPGRALDLLPPAELPEDVAWARSNPRIADALARWIAAVERETAGVVSPAVREAVERGLANWQNEQMPITRHWVEAEIEGLEGEDKAIARLALLLAKAPYQVDDDIVEELVTGDEERFVRILAWASFVGARRFAAIVAGKARPATKAQFRSRIKVPRAAATALLLALVTLAGCGGGGGVVNPLGTFEARVEKTTPNSVSLSWDPFPGATYYRVFRNGAMWGKVDATRLDWGDAYLDADRTYRYRVGAYQQGDSFFNEIQLAASVVVEARTLPVADWVHDDIGEWGYVSNIAVDSRGAAHVLHCRSGLQHVTDVTGAWTPSALGDGCRSRIVAGPDDSLHAIVRRDGQPTYGRLVAGAFSTEIIEPVRTNWRSDRDLALRADATVHVAYVADDYGVRYATNESGSWVVHAVGDDPEVEQLALAVGEHVHLVYRAQGMLYDWTNATGAWTTEWVAGHARGGIDCSLDDQGVLHVVTYSDEALEHFTRDEAGWRQEAIEPVIAFRGDVSLAVGPDGALHVSYTAPWADLKYATNAGGSWATLFVAVNGDVGGVNSLALDSSGLVHILYGDLTTKMLRRAHSRPAR